MPTDLLQICNVLCRNESKAFGGTKVHVVAICARHVATDKNTIGQHLLASRLTEGVRLLWNVL